MQGYRAQRPPITIRATRVAMELGQLLQLLDDWLATGHEQVEGGAADAEVGGDGGDGLDRAWRARAMSSWSAVFGTLGHRPRSANFT